MEAKQIVTAVICVVALFVIFPIVYTNWPRDPQPALDKPKIEEMYGALVRYNKDFGELPKDLKYLVPDYLPEIPIASNREPFRYDPATGKITPPYPAPGGTTTGSIYDGMTFGNSGPMGEIMTGISIQNELNY